MWTVILPLLVLTAISFGILWYRFCETGWGERNGSPWREFWPRLLIFGLPPFIIALIVYGIGFHSMKTFKEYWNNMYVEVSHYDAWDEKVSCRHPHYHTEPYSRTYRGSDGKMHHESGTRRVQHGHEHSYDVDNNPERWQGLMDNGDEKNISQSDYQHYSMIWENSTKVDMNRPYYSKDGDKQQSSWNKKQDTVFPITTIHTYENRVRASGAFENEDIPDDLKTEFKHPIETGSMDVVFAHGLPFNTSVENDRLKKINAMLGHSKEIHIMLFVIDASTYNQTVVKVVNQIWGGPNKNELAVFVGANEAKEIIWCDVLSWSVNKELHGKIIEKINGLGMYDGLKIVDEIAGLVPGYWQRKHFADFKKVAIATPRYIYITAGMLFVVFHAAMWLTVGIWTFVPSKPSLPSSRYYNSKTNGFGGVRY